VVVFPDPFGPRNPKISPAKISKETPLIIHLPPIFFLTSRTDITASGILFILLLPIIGLNVTLVQSVPPCVYSLPYSDGSGQSTNNFADVVRTSRQSAPTAHQDIHTHMQRLWR